MAIAFNIPDKVIEITGVTEVYLQDIHDAIRDFEYGWRMYSEDYIANAYGKQSLGGGTYIGITLELINDWRIQFEAQGSPTNCYIRGGNLVAINQYSNDPLKAQTNVHAIIAQSSSATLSQLDDITDIKDNVGWMYEVDGGKIEIVDTDGGTMIMYASDNVTEKARFALYDENNNRTKNPAAITKRVRI
jgi:hypothetical protein